jgi:glycerol-3-phosphate acyltransferase PlsY
MSGPKDTASAPARAGARGADAILARVGALPSIVERLALDQALTLRALLVVVGYLVGSIPVGVIVARLSGGPDPRTIGSGRTGGTNALRALGRKWAALVVAGDLAKGALPVLFARILTNGDSLVEVLVAAAAVAGSVRSIFLKFQGGRGVGTGVGTMLVIQPLAVVLAAPVFFLVILATRYVSLGSLLGSAAMFPAMVIIWAVASGWVPPAYLIWAAVGPVLIWLAHADNIDRLIHGKERKFDLGLITEGGRRQGGA